MTRTEAARPDAVLLMGYGSPRGPEDLPGYLAEVLHRRPSPELVQEYVRRYERIGGSPQNRILDSLRGKLEQRLARDRPGTVVYLGTKHWHPSLAEVIPRAARDGHRRVIAVATTPYAAKWITDPYLAGVADGRAAAASPIEVEVRAGWHLDPHWIGYWARAIRHELGPGAGPAVLLSAHALPRRMLDLGDPYPELLAATARAIAAEARLDQWSFTYQSPGNATEPWTQPDINDELLRWKARGETAPLIASFGFVFDHLEVLYDLDVVVREFAEANGIRYRRVPMPNDADAVVEALAARVLGPADPAAVGPITAAAARSTRPRS